MRRPAQVVPTADALGKGNDCGVGGASFPSGRLRRFSHCCTVAEITACFASPRRPMATWIGISSCETLAHCFILLPFVQTSGNSSLTLKLPAERDSSGAESVCNKFYTSKVPLNLFIRELTMLTLAYGSLAKRTMTPTSFQNGVARRLFLKFIFRCASSGTSIFKFYSFPQTFPVWGATQIPRSGSFLRSYRGTSQHT